jgi:uncharacterized protein (DUF4415 family)
VRYDPAIHKSRTDWARVNALTDQEIAEAVAGDPDAAPLLDEEWVRHAVLWEPAPKTAVSIRIDQPILDWFKARGPRYQTRINAVLRAYVESQKGRGKRAGPKTKGKV